MSQKNKLRSADGRASMDLIWKIYTEHKDGKNMQICPFGQIKEGQGISKRHIEENSTLAGFKSELEKQAC